MALAANACTHVETTGGAVVANEHPFLWKVEGHGAEAWLFGTMHVSDTRVTTLHQVVTDALAAADYLATELDESPANGAKLAQQGMLPDGSSLKDLLTPELYRGIHDYLQSRGMDNQQVDHMRPWMVALQLAQIDAIPLLQDGQPLDILLRKSAREAGKEVGQVENIDEQIAVLAWGSEEDQIHLLQVTLAKLLEEQASGSSSLEHLLGYYLSGNGEEMWQFALGETDFEDPLQVGAWQALTTERNRRMATRIERLLEEDPTVKRFFAFGTLHFLGPESVIARLRDHGYNVERIVPQREEAEISGADSK